MPNRIVITIDTRADGLDALIAIGKISGALEDLAQACSDANVTAAVDMKEVRAAAEGGAKRGRKPKLHRAVPQAPLAEDTRIPA